MRGVTRCVPARSGPWSARWVLAGARRFSTVNCTCLSAFKRLTAASFAAVFTLRSPPCVLVSRTAHRANRGAAASPPGHCGRRAAAVASTLSRPTPPLCSHCPALFRFSGQKGGHTARVRRRRPCVARGRPPTSTDAAAAHAGRSPPPSQTALKCSLPHRCGMLAGLPDASTPAIRPRTRVASCQAAGAAGPPGGGPLGRSWGAGLRGRLVLSSSWLSLPFCSCSYFLKTRSDAHKELDRPRPRRRGVGGTRTRLPSPRGSQERRPRQTCGASRVALEGGTSDCRGLH